MIEFASRDRPTVVSEWAVEKNLGSHYAARKAARFPAFEPSRDHSRTIATGRELSPWVREWGRQVEELLSRPVLSPWVERWGEGVERLLAENERLFGK